MLPTPTYRNDPSAPAYWDERYQQGNTGWDMGKVSPPLSAYFSQLQDRSISILISGCGNSYEAAWLLENGFFSVTVIDIAPCLLQLHPAPCRNGTVFHRTETILIISTN